MCWRQYLACRRLKIHHIEGLVRRSNYTVALLQGIKPVPLHERRATIE